MSLILDFRKRNVYDVCLIYQIKYNEICIIRLPLGLEKSGLYLQVVFISRSIQYMIITICSKISGIRILLVFLDSGHIIQVSLYVQCLFTFSTVGIFEN